MVSFNHKDCGKNQNSHNKSRSNTPKLSKSPKTEGTMKRWGNSVEFQKTCFSESIHRFLQSDCYRRDEDILPFVEFSIRFSTEEITSKFTYTDYAKGLCVLTLMHNCYLAIRNVGHEDNPEFIARYIELKHPTSLYSFEDCTKKLALEAESMPDSTEFHAFLANGWNKVKLVRSDERTKQKGKKNKKNDEGKHESKNLEKISSTSKDNANENF